MRLAVRDGSGRGGKIKSEVVEVGGKRQELGEDRRLSGELVRLVVGRLSGGGQKLMLESCLAWHWSMSVVQIVTERQCLCG